MRLNFRILCFSCLLLSAFFRGFAQKQEEVKVSRILTSLQNSAAKSSSKSDLSLSRILNTLENPSGSSTTSTLQSDPNSRIPDKKTDVKTSRILTSLETPSEELRIGKEPENVGILGVLNTIDDSEAVETMTDMMLTVNPPEPADAANVLDFMIPAGIDGSADAILTEYYSSPEAYEKNIVDAALANFYAVDVLDVITGTYNENYYDNGFWGKDSQNATLSLYKGAIPKYDPADFYRPVWGRITSNFGFRSSFGRMHKGVDLALNVGDTVRAALPGVVGRVGYDPGGYGNFVVVAHSNGVETRYAHLQQATVLPGQKVEAGDAIALGGNTGNSTGPHLHFEVRYMGTAMDPLALFDFNGRNMNFGTKKIAKESSRKLATGLSGTKTSLKEKSTYVVRQGDTVKSVAKRAGITPLRLCQLNFITEDTPLQPGTMLKLK